MAGDSSTPPPASSSGRRSNGVLVGERDVPRDARERSSTSAGIRSSRRASPSRSRRGSRACEAGRRGGRACERDRRPRTSSWKFSGGIWNASSASGRPHLVTVFGDAGVGKSRVAAEFRRIVEDFGGFAVSGRALPYRESSAYGAFASHIKQLCHIFESDTRRRARRNSARDRGDDARPVDGDRDRRPSRDPGRARPESAVADRETLFFSVRVLHRSRRARSSKCSSCSKTSTGRTRAFSTSSSCSARDRETCRFSFSCWHGRSFSMLGLRGAAVCRLHGIAARPVE